MIADRMRMIDSSGIRKVFDLAAKLKDPVNLSIGQPDFDTPEPIKQSAIQAIQDGFNRYTLTGGIPQLKESLLLKLEQDKKKSFEDIIITNGVSGALFLALMVLINPGDEVIIPDPYFVSYKHLVNFLNGKPVFVDTYPEFTISKSKLENAITSTTKLLILNSPSNPTGKIYNKKELEDIAEIAAKHDLLILSDEIYDLFTYDEKYTSICELYSKVLLISGFSKTFSMTGWRLGYSAGPKEIIQEMIKIQQYTFVCAPSFAQYAILNHLSYDMSKEIEDYKRKRDYIFNNLDPAFECQKANGAFYLFPKAPHGTGQSFVEKAIENNLLIIPGSVFSEKNTHFRISFATSEEQLKRGVDILNSLINKI